jgi:nicotinate-nucleotide adenylyltransferase
VKVGILGGSFDPVHLGHLVIGQETAELLGLEVVYLVPCRVPPHKPDRRLAATRHRMRMLVEAVKDNPRFAVSEIELKRRGPSYSVDTLHAFRQLLGAPAELYLIVGMDSLAQIESWHRPDDIFRLARVVAAGRPGYRQESAPTEFRDRALRVDVTLTDISSSRIRRFVREGRSIRYLVPREVAAYIHKERLYR